MSILFAFAGVEPRSATNTVAPRTTRSLAPFGPAATVAPNRTKNLAPAGSRATYSGSPGNTSGFASGTTYSGSPGKAPPAQETTYSGSPGNTSGFASGTTYSGSPGKAPSPIENTYSGSPGVLPFSEPPMTTTAYRRTATANSPVSEDYAPVYPNADRAGASVAERGDGALVLYAPTERQIAASSLSAQPASYVRTPAQLPPAMSVLQATGRAVAGHAFSPAVRGVRVAPQPVPQELPAETIEGNVVAAWQREQLMIWMKTGLGLAALGLIAWAVLRDNEEPE